MANDKKYFTPTELESMCQSILMYSKIPFGRREELDVEHEAYLRNSTKEKLFKDITKTLTTWYFYLSIHIKIENYELCSLIKQTIEVEKKEFMFYLKKFCIEYEKEDKQFLEEIEKEIREFYKI